MAKKTSAAERTVDMFAAPKTEAAEAKEAAETAEAEEAKAGRVPLEEDADRLRDTAFKVQEWTTKFFGLPMAEGNEYRCSKKGDHYYLERLAKKPGAKEAYGYMSYMIPEADLESVVKVLVQAYREKNK